MWALTIRQPWIEAILRLHKRIENRTWSRCPRAMVGKPLALHASSACARDDYEAAAKFMAERELAFPAGSPELQRRGDVPDLPALRDLPLGAVVGRARLVNVVRTDHGGHRLTGGDRCALCDRVLAGLLAECPKADPWAIPGQLGLILADVEPLRQPVPWKGSLGFFEIPDEVMSRGARPVGASR